MTLPETYDHVELGHDAPEPDESDDCPDCGNYWCPPDCRPRFVSPYRSRYVPRVENGDPES